MTTPEAWAALAALADTRVTLLSGVELPSPTGVGAMRAAARPPGAPAPAAEPVFGEGALSDVQGNVVPGFLKDHQSFLFLAFGDADRAREWLRWLAPRLTTMGEALEFRREFRAARLRRGVREPGMRATWTSVALSHHGIAALRGAEEADLFGDESFRQGLAARSTYLGDPTDPAHRGHRDHWVVGGPGNEADALVVVAADDPADLDAAGAAVLEAATEHGLSLLHDQRGENLPGNLRGHEHFGFKDGVSQPGIRGVLAGGEPVTPRLLADDDPRADLFARPGQPLLWPGQLLLGEPRQDPQDPAAPAPPSTAFPRWARHGSYLVCRRLAQDVPGFWEAAARIGAELGVPAVRLASALVGRWPSGAPVSRSPLADDPELAGDELAANHFLFEDDTRASRLVPVPGYPGDRHRSARSDVLGRVCPHAAHIRKVNPRDSGTDFGAPADTLLRLMVRRGIPYGEPLAGVRDPAPELVAAERGLVFVACMASIEDQFEFVTRRWANSPLQPNPGGPDPVIGQRDRRGDRTRTLDLDADVGRSRVTLERDFVTPTGGGYFFVPPISAVRGALAEKP
jgi:Dyp-type peroxidase family